MGALLFIYPDAEDAYRVEERIDRAERTGSAAERSCCHHHPDEEEEQDGHFKHEEPPRRGAKHGIQTEEGNSRLQRPRRAELAEPGFKGDVRYDEDENHQQKVFKIIQPLRNISLGQFYLIEKVLHETEGAPPAADNPPADSADDGEKPQGIKGDMVGPVGCHKLDGADRTGKQG